VPTFLVRFSFEWPTGAVFFSHDFYVLMITVFVFVWPIGAGCY